MKKVYNGGFVPQFSVSMLKEIIALVGDYVPETRKYKPKLSEKYMKNRNMKSFSKETLNFFFTKFWASYILDLAKPDTVLLNSIRLFDAIFWITKHKETLKSHVVKLVKGA